jgi:hypothetical protein
MKKLMLLAVIGLSSSIFAATGFEVKNTSGQIRVNKTTVPDNENTKDGLFLVGEIDDLSSLSAKTGYYFAVHDSTGKRYGITSSKVGFPSPDAKKKALIESDSNNAIKLIDIRGNVLARITPVRDGQITTPDIFFENLESQVK